ncbi:MAG: hypothetical protein C0599_09810 [Salinivirgaceae bacterium]|nr:MAG: hypothetical protein C0599_09810 [Salinivirgaceae bacterium]
MKNILFALFALLLITACKEETDKLNLVQQYYEGLNSGDYKKASSVLSDNFIMRENEDNFEVSFSPEKFHDWFQWDSVFQPTYEIKSSELVNDTLRLAITKKCDRIMLFNEAPLTNLAYFEISDGKIKAINRYSYLGADWQRWSKNKERFLEFARTYLPEYTYIEQVQNLEYGYRFKKTIEMFQFYDQNPITLNTSGIRLNTSNFKFDDWDIPKADYYLLYNNDADSIFIYNELQGSKISPEEYAEYNLPENAITPIYSYWAGGGLIHYLVKSNSNLIIYKCEFDEMEVAEAKEGDNPYTYEKFRIIKTN